MYSWLLPNKIGPYLDWTFTSMPSGIVKVQKPQLRWSFPQICLCTAANSNQQLHIFYSFLTNYSNNAPSNHYSYWAWSACTCLWEHAAKRCCWLHGSDSCYQQPHLPEACCHWNFQIQIKYGLPYCVTCPSMSMDPGSLNPGGGIPGSIRILGQVTQFWQNILNLYYSTGS